MKAGATEGGMREIEHIPNLDTFFFTLTFVMVYALLIWDK